MLTPGAHVLNILSSPYLKTAGTQRLKKRPLQDSRTASTTVVRTVKLNYLTIAVQLV